MQDALKIIRFQLTFSCVFFGRNSLSSRCRRVWPRGRGSASSRLDFLPDLLPFSNSFSHFFSRVKSRFFIFCCLSNFDCGTGPGLKRKTIGRSLQSADRKVFYVEHPKNIHGKISKKQDIFRISGTLPHFKIWNSVVNKIVLFTIQHMFETFLFLRYLIDFYLGKSSETFRSLSSV